jgi:hypothetical protein
MGSSILSEVDDTSILRTGLSTCYGRPLDWRPASRLLPPRSGLERSDFVRWHIATDANALTLRPLLGHYGSPARLVASDPRAFALHKAWLPHREDRESLKAVRDLEQAKAAATIATRYLKN